MSRMSNRRAMIAEDKRQKTTAIAVTDWLSVGCKAAAWRKGGGAQSSRRHTRALPLQVAMAARPKRGAV